LKFKIYSFDDLTKGSEELMNIWYGH
jgi:hypothetical protein